MSVPAAVADTKQPSIPEAKTAIQAAYNAVYTAEQAGANVHQLISRLSSAGNLLAQAENTQNSLTPTNTTTNTANAIQIAQQVKSQAENLTKQNALNTQNNVYLTSIISITGAAWFAGTLMFAWSRFAHNYTKRQTNSQKLNHYRPVFLAVGLIGVMLFASPAVGQLLTVPSSEPFSAIYLLGTDQNLLAVPSTVQNGTAYSAYLCIDNHEKTSTYYVCQVKLRNETEPLPNTSLLKPSSLPSLYQYTVFLENNQTWQAPFKFQINTHGLNASSISSITINDKEVAINKTTTWNSQNNGYYYDLIVELWKCNPSSGVVEFDNRFVHFYLNLTTTPSS